MTSSAKLLKRPRDTNQLAKLGVDILMGKVEDREGTPMRGVDPAASAMGKKGGDGITRRAHYAVFPRR
jgi:hypothetical protein